MKNFDPEEVSDMFDVAFAPINPRLIDLSIKLSQLLNSRGVSSTILKTSIIGDNHNGWSSYEDVNLNDISVTKINEMYFYQDSNFISYTYRIIKSRRAMETNFVPNFKVLILFMDDFAEAEVLIPIIKKYKIPIVLFQEGFFVTEIQNNFNLYALAKYLRKKILRRFFTSREYGENADHFIIWSDYGFKDYVKKIGFGEEKSSVVGNPYSSVKKRKEPSKNFKNILINHSPLSPRFSTKRWEGKLWVNLSNLIIKENYIVGFKPHPRVDYDDVIDLLSTHLNQEEHIFKLLDRSLSSESFYDEYDVLINIASASSFEALYRGIPVIFIKSQFGNVKILDELSHKKEILLAESIDDIPKILNKLNNDIEFRNNVIESGYKAADKLGGELNIFERKFTNEVKKIIEKNENYL